MFFVHSLLHSLTKHLLSVSACHALCWAAEPQQGVTPCPRESEADMVQCFQSLSSQESPVSVGVRESRNRESSRS